ncbi:MAG: hypothetical protein JXP34_05590 [Planctomycetes bacterium]|nr:hypothetical protein [Planctomycetota bacterium]
MIPVILAVMAAVAPSGEGFAAILREPGMPIRGAASSPETLATILRAGGISTRFLSASELADPAILDASAIDFVVIPAGETFPVEARDAFVAFLRSGGGFVSMGGYAFDHLVRKVDGRWIREEDRLAAARERATRPERSLIPGGGFEGDPAPGGTCSIVAEDPKEGAWSARIDVREGAVPYGAQAWFEVPAKPGAAYQVSGWMRTSDVAGDGMAYIALYQNDESGGLVTFRDFAKARGTTPWTRYAFDVNAAPGAARLFIRFGLYLAHGTAWFDDFRLSDISGLRFEPMNTSTGVPEDGLVVSPAQMGLFDASFRLKRVARIRAASGPSIAREPIDMPGAFEGWAASGVVGSDDARWIPILDAFDRYDRPRAAAAALLVHYRGFYAGSTWAYFGIEDRDLFADARGPMARVLQDAARILVRRIFLRNLATELRLYGPGEEVNVSVFVENRGRRPRSVEVALAMGGREVHAMRRVAAGGSERAEAIFPAPPAGPEVVRVDATLSLDGETIDRMSTGVVIEDADAIRAGSPLRFEKNYFTFGGRPLLLFGTDTYAEVYKTASENPLTWSQELRAARDAGMNLYENLQYTNPGHVFSDAEWRAFRAMAQLTQAENLVFMPGILIGHNVAVGEARLAEESALCAEYARRLRDVPGLLYYINGDYQLRLEGDPPAGVDRLVHELDLARRWNEAHVAAIRAEDAHHPITSEYYQRAYGGLDMARTIDGLDVANFGYFDEPGADIDGLPEAIRRNDLRARGKGVSLGEYGVKTHSAWSRENGATGYHIIRTEEEQRDLFLAVAHYALGMGASKIQNWCLRDSQVRVFPWGIFHPNRLIPKDIAFVHRNLSVIWRHLGPRYVPPEESEPVRVRPEDPWLHVMRQPTAKADAHVVYNARKGKGSADVTIETAAGEIALRARDRGPALAVVTGDGRVVVIEAWGAARIRGAPILSGTGLAALLALDGRDLRRSTAILVAPFETGRIEVSSASKLAACAGEFRDGAWTALERFRPDSRSGAIDVDGDRATCLILLCAPAEEERWAAHLTRALRHPESIEGF